MHDNTVCIRNLDKLNWLFDVMRKLIFATALSASQKLLCVTNLAKRGNMIIFESILIIFEASIIIFWGNWDSS